MCIFRLIVLSPLVATSILAHSGLTAEASESIVGELVRWRPQYILHVQVVGYEDLVVYGGDEPAAEVLREMKVPITIGVPFKQRLQNKGQTLSVSGQATRKSNGRFLIDIRCADQYESGGFVRDRQGRLVPTLSGVACHSSLLFDFDENMVTAGEFSSGSGQTLPDGSYERRRSKTRITIRLEEYKAKSVRRTGTPFSIFER